MNSKEIIDQYNSAVVQSYGRLDLALESGSGTRGTDADGRTLIDFGSGIGTNSLGYADSEWADAVSAQAHRVQHVSNYYYNSTAAEFARKLTGMTGTDKLFFGNSGAEANECAIKIARKRSFDRYGDRNRTTIITLVNSFHGRTVTTLSATGQEQFHNYFFPFTPGFKYVEANNIPALREAIDPTVCAVMFEFIQGEGGVNVLEQDFVDEIFALAKQHDLATISDEVQTGMGRTGRLLAADYFHVKPDIVTLAKGLGGGLPIGVCLTRGEYAEVLTPGTHGSTFGGNPVVCAGGLVVLKRLSDPAFLAELEKKAAYFRSSLEALPKVKSVTGLGLMLGAELDGIAASDLLKAALEKGLLVLTAKTKLRCLPPLTISYEQIDAGMEILKEVLENE
ncbi:MAG: acetylornithine/succinylornithine family transaminase [Clostridia bacterium]|nr:acetylornithine/succinylornithine family transaminase [Clostridia bacterium]